MKAQKVTLDKVIELEGGGRLFTPRIAYHTYGKLNAAKDNVVWVCHALTANSDVFDWWKGLFGPTDLFNPKEHFIVCANILGSHYGTSSPLSINPESGEPYYYSFPNITIRDMVQLHEELAKALKIDKIKVLIGGSMGGQQCLEWAVAAADRFEKLVVIASNAVHSPWGAAFNASQRMAIANDPSWGNQQANAGLEGMKVARSLALLSYRNFDAYGKTQQAANAEEIYPERAAAYQRHQGEKLAGRFNAFSYWCLSKAMDSHNVGRGQGGVKRALSKIKARALVISLENDLLFPQSEQEQIAEGIAKAAHRVVPSAFGHDGFLIETKTLSRIIGSFLILNDQLDGKPHFKPALPLISQSRIAEKRLDVKAIGLLGFGNVGKAFFEQIKNRDDVCISKVGIKRDLASRNDVETSAQKLFTKDCLSIIRDPKIPIIVELIDDDGAALTYAEESLKRGKIFISANKKMLANNMPALRELELIHGGRLLYEASVAGAIPILRNIKEYYQSEPIRSIKGIINGSTNYILSKMTMDKLSFEVALAKAQELGFAESDPTLDVEAYDAVYKSVLLAYTALDVYVKPEKVAREGIANVNSEQIATAAAEGKKIKLISSIVHDLRGGVSISVRPRLIPSADELYHIENELNAVAVDGLFSEVTVFKGRGAGGHPTASAVVADLDFALNKKEAASPK